MAKLVIVRAPSGFGKTTWAKEFVNYEIVNYTHLEADMFHVNDVGEYVWKPENLKAAHKWCFDTTKILLRNGQNVIVSNTFTRISEFSEYITWAKQNGHEVIVNRLYKNYGNVHNVPEDRVQAMIDRMEDYPGEIDVTNTSGGLRGR